MKGSFKVSMLLVITIVSLLMLSVPSSDAAISCSAVIQDVAPCVTYLRSGSGLPPAACCSGAKALAAAAKATDDKQAACACLKSASRSLNPNPGLAKSLPGNCGISLGFTISANVDCTKIT
ncbi:putative plant lipid transfer protein/Par allergen [Helianthus anomalus]